MRKLISGAAALLALSAGTALADENVVTTQQAALVQSSNIKVDQLGANATATIRQLGEGELLNASIEQRGATSFINSNIATIEQQGKTYGSEASIDQNFTLARSGTPNNASILQQNLSDGSFAGISQEGGGNRATIEQTANIDDVGSSYVEASILQSGDGNVAQVQQSGNYVNVSISQVGRFNDASVSQGNGVLQDYALRIGLDQFGSNNSAVLVQSGVQNQQLVTQR